MESRTVYLRMLARFICGEEIKEFVDEETGNKILCWTDDDNGIVYGINLTPAELELYNAAQREEECSHS